MKNITVFNKSPDHAKTTVDLFFYHNMDLKKNDSFNAWPLRDMLTRASLSELLLANQIVKLRPFVKLRIVWNFPVDK